MNGSSSATAQINAQPQDFVVVDGKKFRVNRSSRAGFVNDSKSDSSYLSEHFDGDSIESLKKALKNANQVINQQNDKIVRQARQIENLTQQMNLNHVSEEAVPRRDSVGTRQSDSAGSAGSSNSVESWHSNVSNRSGSGLAARRRAETIENGQKHNDMTEVDSPAEADSNEISIRSRSLFCSDNIFVETDNERSTAPAVESPQDWSSTRSSTISPTRTEAEFISPTNVNALINQFNGKSTTEIKPVVNTDRNSLGVEMLSDVSISPPPLFMQNEGRTTPLRNVSTPSTGPPRGLAARLAMGSQERRKLATDRRTKTGQGSSPSPHGSSPNPRFSPKCLNSPITTISPRFEDETGLNSVDALEEDYEGQQ
jgi:hypothetical protein